MVSKTFAAVLALSSAAFAAPALVARQSDPCQDAYKSCIAAGTPEVACTCTLTACLGEDNARNRDYCSSATASLSQSTPTATTYACNPAHSYPNGAKCVSTNGALTLVTSTPAATAAATTYACNPAHSYPNGAKCISTNGALTLATAAPSSAQAAATSAAAASAAAVAAPGSNPVKVDGKTWSITDLFRYCGNGNTGCDYNFNLNSNGKTQHCTVVRMPGSNAATESWSNQECTTGSDIKVSWGYTPNPAPAFAVITIVNGKELAWFGVPNVNEQPVTASNPFGSGQYGNLTAQQVYTYN